MHCMFLTLRWSCRLNDGRGARLLQCHGHEQCRHKGMPPLLWPLAPRRLKVCARFRRQTG